MFRSEVEFGAVAGRNDHCLRRFCEGDQLSGGGPKIRRADGKFLPHLHRGGAVIKAETEEFHQTNAKTNSERINNTTADNDSRRPVKPRTFFTPKSTP